MPSCRCRRDPRSEADAILGRLLIEGESNDRQIAQKRSLVYVFGIYTGQLVGIRHVHAKDLGFARDSGTYSEYAALQAFVDEFGLSWKTGPRPYEAHITSKDVP